jgi:hypothetical protein
MTTDGRFLSHYLDTVTQALMPEAAQRIIDLQMEQDVVARSMHWPLNPTLEL